MNPNNYKMKLISQESISYRLPKNQLTILEARVAIRFMRIGRIHEPFYRVVAVDSRKKRDTEPIEFLGWYNPKTKEANLTAPAIKKWLGFGAQPSETVKGLFKRAAVLRKFYFKKHRCSKLISR